MAASKSRFKEMAHYKQGPIECIDAMESAFGAEQLAIFCCINAMKYLWRMPHHPAGPEENLRKALYYLNKALTYEVQLKAGQGPDLSGD
jgi:hypothetical protein|eukprot:COSAG01_NODE_32021_length_587_cov_2.176230_1_plen_89_part_00